MIYGLHSCEPACPETFKSKYVFHSLYIILHRILHTDYIIHITIVRVRWVIEFLKWSAINISLILSNKLLELSRQACGKKNELKV